MAPLNYQGIDNIRKAGGTEIVHVRGLEGGKQTDRITQGQNPLAAKHKETQKGKTAGNYWDDSGTT